MFLVCWQSKWGVVSAFRPGTTPKSPNATTSFTTFFRPFFCSVRGGNLQPHQATDHLHVTGSHTAPTFARFPASPFGVLGFIPLIQIPCIAVAQFMDVAVQQRPSPLAPPLQNTTGRAGGSIVPDAPRPLADHLETAHHTFRCDEPVSAHKATRRRFRPR